MATYHKPSSVSEKKVVYQEFEPCFLARLYSLYGRNMDKIYECGANFNKIIKIKYHFTISVNRKIRQLALDFQTEDFRHASGLHYVDDISIENDPAKMIQAILDGKITDEILDKSSKYKTISKDSGSVKERIDEMCYLEKYLDSSDFIRVYEMQDFGSRIKADYFIEVSKINRHATVYIFIRKRVENENYVMVSFFKKHNVYKGSNAYWMVKEKEVNGVKTELYRNPNYKEKI